MPEERSAEQDVRIGRTGGQGWHADWHIPAPSHAQTWRLFRRMPGSRFLLQFKPLWAHYPSGNSAKIHAKSMNVILFDHELQDTKQ
jgi:hypothetical protein